VDREKEGEKDIRILHFLGMREINEQKRSEKCVEISLS